MVNDDRQFRRGATHGAQWFRDEVRRMTSEGLSAEQIDKQLGDLNGVLTDWRNNQAVNKLPAGNPWEWKVDDLSAYIERRRSEW